jgi:hypothetical protein
MGGKMMFKVIFKFLKKRPSLSSPFYSLTFSNEIGKNSAESRLVIVESGDGSHDFGSDLEMHKTSAAGAGIASSR